MTTARGTSVTRGLLWSVALPLALFFALTGFGLDYLFRDLVERSINDLLDQRLAALVSAAESRDDDIDVRISDPDARLAVPGSGHYAQIQDAHGKPLLSRLVKGGESVRLDGTAPLLLRVGNAPATEVVYRGQPIDLAPRTSGSIARLELP